ncbi:uncharacterized protein Dana_GF19721 [Drosophila ananassae]|uniref:Glutamyl-tRNA(Gln) amidotransferase subunit C, mitochondrial n=1 Tax=Drosophila ananassae TaxID=7217 RepID=GATC_DROAN|nr:glutamyl-tRNA(Gln) amidotransferase subunit C, mitochondrial [Drosophila ananassae]B3MN22.1 RecName: Full=Glutamyl-tRNA(Gln) amidotransferase subunit C, mitochondrial; Short=Glu-AdT subunit C; Flags: Precursor [Drosophila ananassae]EDV32000.1 uncharacterized protein Dana_GF19721 [Drosophila ananassae]
MLRLLNKRFYCKFATKTKVRPEKLNFKQLTHPTKVPQTPVKAAFPNTSANEIELDPKSIQLLERLALVDLDSERALETLKSSIQFADKITHIQTDNVRPLYTVLEQQQLQLRNDLVTEGDCRGKVLSNAKVTDEDYFVSPPGNIPLEQ